ncbi:hypothetical protein SDC9_97337 [bioreactor metagenome]|uniref:Uncharacterized protein n=1 Tax=bioreactor metagenome TaxID=1076179 RepID=A0A645ABK7_9ZZZZ
MTGRSKCLCGLREETAGASLSWKAPKVVPEQPGRKRSVRRVSCAVSRVKGDEGGCENARMQVVPRMKVRPGQTVARGFFSRMGTGEQGYLFESDNKQQE